MKIQISESMPISELTNYQNSFYPVSSQHDEAKELIKELKARSIIYESAVKEIMTKLSILNSEFVELHSRNPIHTMQSRIKKPTSVIDKLRRKGVDLSMRMVKSEIEDIAGIRIICPYIKDIYVVKQLVENQDDLKILRTVDYIKKPKPNGYRSLHMIVLVPVFFSDHKERVKVEVQIRTIAMDFWASLEHQLRYKATNVDEIPEDISDELKACADIIAETDIRMQDIHNRVFHY